MGVYNEWTIPYSSKLEEMTQHDSELPDLSISEEDSNFLSAIGLKW